MAEIENPQLGDLAPVHDALTWLTARLEEERSRNAEDDRAVLALQDVHKRLAGALVEAANPAAEISLEALAKREGVKVSTLYKRRQRGKLTGARKRAGRLVIPVSSLES